jgi:hypothetical protein
MCKLYVSIYKAGPKKCTHTLTEVIYWKFEKKNVRSKDSDGVNLQRNL